MAAVRPPRKAPPRPPRIPRAKKSRPAPAIEHVARRVTVGPKVAVKVAKAAGIEHLRRPASAHKAPAA